MVSLLIIFLIAIDLALLGFVIYLGRKKIDNEALIAQLTEERRYLNELKNSVHEDIEAMQAQNRSLLKRVSEIATEAELEVKSGGDTLAKEMEGLVNGLSSKIDQPIKVLTSKQNSVEKTIKKAEKERQLLAKAMQRAETLVRFFDEKVPYDVIVRELQERKYHDARSLLAQGMPTDKVARELGLSSHEVELIADIS